MKKQSFIVAGVLVCVVLSSSHLESVAAQGSADCIGACTTGCVNRDQRLTARCNRKCSIKCDPAAMAMLLKPLLLGLLFTYIAFMASATTISLYNKCSHPVCPGIQPSAGQPILARGGFKLQPNKASPSDFTGTVPQPQSGHTAVNIGKSKIVVFGGLVDKQFISGLCVYDFENKLWFQPECSENGSDGQVGPSSRAFHIAVAIDCQMFVFGGPSGSKRLGDFWVLDTDIWQWSELTSFGDLPSPRDFAAASAIGNRKIVMHGGWDGKKWLSDVYVLDTISLEWMELSVSGSLPPPRCGHTATMVEKRMLVYGGRGGGGPIMGDLWALKGLLEEGW